MNRILLGAVASGVLALPLAASVQADATVYGNLRFGAEMSDNDKTQQQDHVESRLHRSSRWGVKGSDGGGGRDDGRIQIRKSRRLQLIGR